MDDYSNSNADINANANTSYDEEDIGNDDAALKESNAPKSDVMNYTDVIEKMLKREGKKTTPYLTKFEKARLIGARAQQISAGAIPMVSTQGMKDPVKIALKELHEKKLPIFIRRYLPNGTHEDWKIDELLF
jgi:DNA-directed RNA polymerase I, II, and III subunit RPABC2